MSLIASFVTLGLILMIIDKWVIRPISVLTLNVINPRTKEDLTKFVSGLTRRVSMKQTKQLKRRLTQTREQQL